jgi:hypothetical protein
MLAIKRARFADLKDLLLISLCFALSLAWFRWAAL